MSAQPDFIQADPTVYGFDFNALANTAAGVSGGVPDSHSAPVVRHGEAPRTGNDAIPSSMSGLQAGYGPRQPPVGDRPPGYPWQGHGSSIPNYPWQGHPQIAYSQPFLGPEGTSPQTRSGPNVGAYANAPTEPLAYTGGPYPYAAAGTYTPNPTNPSAGAYAGLDLGASREDRQRNREDRQRNRAFDREERRQQVAMARQAQKNQIDVTDGPYVYRLYSGGAIKILVSPKGGAGTVLNRGDRGYSAIIAKVGSFRDNAIRGRQSNITALAQGITAVTQAAGGGRRRKRGKGRGRGRGGPPMNLPPESNALPPWVVPAGIAGVVALTIFLATRKKG